MSSFMPPNVSSLTCCAYQPRGKLVSENSGRCARQNDLFAASLAQVAEIVLPSRSTERRRCVNSRNARAMAMACTILRRRKSHVAMIASYRGAP
jgi:hypothetical protein